MVANQRVQKEMHVVVHVGELERVRERVDATRDKPHRQATATRSARQPDPGAVLSSSASSAVRILSSGAKADGLAGETPRNKTQVPGQSAAVKAKAEHSRAVK